ncbi:MAG TPA: NAD(P)-dependent oxidoreductase [Polyangia bacterium]|nr:NAD(P)-dependent oxidoreductase [Polyangia bacterium]
MRVLVTGATGQFGRALAAGATPPGTQFVLQGRGATPPGWAAGFEWASADLADGRGVVDAVAGVDVIVHAASDPARAATVDVAGTERLVAAAAAAQSVAHIIYVSIVGVDRIPHPYYKRKLAAEQIVRGGRVPWSILRLTQFHSFVAHIVKRGARAPFVILLPKRFRFQNVDLSDAAARTLRAIAEGPRGKLADYGGPEVLTLADAAETWRRARGVKKPIANLPMFGKRAAAFRAGLNTAPDGERGRVTFSEWLAGQA